MELPEEYGQLRTTLGTFLVSISTLERIRTEYKESMARGTPKKDVLEFSDIQEAKITTTMVDIYGMYNCSKTMLAEEHQMHQTFDRIEKENTKRDWDEE